MVIKKSHISYLIYFGIIFPLFWRFISANYGAPYFLSNIVDINLFLFFIFKLKWKNRDLDNKYKKFSLTFWIILIISIILGYSLNTYSIKILFTGIIPYLRLYLIFFAAINFLEINNLEKIYKMLFVLLIINFFIMNIQYSLFGLSQDILGGTFGNSQGCNSIQNILFCSLAAYYFSGYLYGEIKARYVIIVVAITVYLAALAEITAFYFEIAIIFFLTILLTENTRKSLRKKIRIIAPIILLLVIGVYMFLAIFPERAEIITDFSNILTYLGADKGNTGVYKISRIKPFTQMMEQFFEDNIVLNIFGFGIGNCSKFSVFYNNYDSILNYSWFSSAMLILEAGWIGVTLFFAFISSIFIYASRKKKTTNELKIKRWHCLTQVNIIILIIHFMYNSSTRDNYTVYMLVITIIGSFLIGKQKLTKKEDV